MTTSTVIEDRRPAEAARWRTTWARLEDDRRRQAYDEATSAWQRHHDHLVRLRAEAADFHGCRPPAAGLPVEFEDGEVVHRVVPAAQLVEVSARHSPGLPVPGLTTGVRPGAFGRRTPRGLRVLDAGAVVVTDRRVTFSGRHGDREWRFTAVSGLAHHPDAPLSLLHTVDGRRLAGLLAPQVSVLNARFYLTLAFAGATGRRSAVAAEIDDLLAAHEAARPTAPPPARPADAPLTALRPDRRAGTVLAMAVTVVALGAGAFGSAPTGEPYRAEAGAAGPPAAEPSLGEPPAAAEPSRPADPVTPTTGPSPSTAPAATPVVHSGRGSAPAASGTPRAPQTAAHPTTGSHGPGPAPTVRPTTGPAPTAPAPTTAPPPGTAPSPTTAPQPDAPQLITVCLGPIALPLVDPLLCPQAPA
ncbi:hypothetical protein GKC29_16445 [Micromonospora sp. WMMC415]|uniref:hypothetical protein n=1 Tax=Micromonospora sp. WMMC415 TaxID=2675222 RepID=UPI0012B4D9CE|nr:hypothetical protein [Micromonospora sp. WMMC415]QGN48271.1 hypothetical protein GKC29_16445 [Micromonospora sp. WMMC415]